ncbi:hypothetical protein EYF80_010165 [Liparis tanakae]|uniref:Uncharacterized protein n=1 Tax=Liparis tanakae TaxID=230148 RepID=A0A4Z2IQX7_9TELE|nr:hypothetical protein EYF80_010165 [Liparis tanakae]
MESQQSADGAVFAIPSGRRFVHSATSSGEMLGKQKPEMKQEHVNMHERNLWIGLFALGPLLIRTLLVLREPPDGRKMKREQRGDDPSRALVQGWRGRRSYGEGTPGAPVGLRITPSPSVGTGE